MEIVAAVGAEQKAFGNPAANPRVQTETFTSRLSDEVAQLVGNAEVVTVSFSEIIANMRKSSNPDRLPEYVLKVGHSRIRIAIPESSRTRQQGPFAASGRVARHSKSSRHHPGHRPQHLL